MQLHCLDVPSTCLEQKIVLSNMVASRSFHDTQLSDKIIRGSKYIEISDGKGIRLQLSSMSTFLFNGQLNKFASLVFSISIGTLPYVWEKKYLNQFYNAYINIILVIANILQYDVDLRARFQYVDHHPVPIQRTIIFSTHLHDSFSRPWKIDQYIFILYKILHSNKVINFIL